MSSPPCLEDLADPELMARSSEDRPRAFEVLVRRHQQTLVNFFRAMGVYNDAEDLAQVTFVRVFRYRRRYRPTAKFTTFLYMIARQVRIDALRRAKRNETLTRKLTENADAADNETRSGCTDRPDVDRALDRLTPAMRSVVVLNFYQGLKYEEIGEVLGIPTGTVKSRMFQALRHLRQALDEDGEEPP
jgi:RNA polymerase sigma-70 factor, ECF subfamily